MFIIDDFDNPKKQLRTLMSQSTNAITRHWHFGPCLWIWTEMSSESGQIYLNAVFYSAASSLLWKKKHQGMHTDNQKGGRSSPGLSGSHLQISAISSRKHFSSPYDFTHWGNVLVTWGLPIQQLLLGCYGVWSSRGGCPGQLCTKQAQTCLSIHRDPRNKTLECWNHIGKILILNVCASLFCKRWMSFCWLRHVKLTGDFHQSPYNASAGCLVPKECYWQSRPPYNMPVFTQVSDSKKSIVRPIYFLCFIN
jgi:hypothetical protein